MKSNLNVKITRDLKLPETSGVHYRLLCMTGPNKGISYYLKGKRALMGRGEDVDVQVADAKSSREHGELTFVSGSYVITDLGSQNGIVVNDLKVSQHRLEDGDKIIIGQTVFKFSISKVEEILSLVQASDDDDDEESDEEKSIVPSDNSVKIKGQAKTKKKKKKADNKEFDKKKLIYAGVGLLLLLLLLPSEEKSQGEPNTTPSLGANQDQGTVFTPVGATPQREEDREQERKLNAVIHRGLREFREANYFRAIEEFNFALLMSPNHGRATFYLNRTRQRLDEEIELNFFKARQEADALKFDAAIVSYCSIIRLLRDYKDDERYIVAEKEIESVKKRMGYVDNEDRCYTGQ